MRESRSLRYPLLMAALTLFLIWKIHLGLFHDEVMVINLGKMLVEGDSFVQFTGIGMSHYLLWPLMAVFHRVMGSYDGVFLYLRYWFVLIQLLLAVYTYTTLKLFWSEKQATAASILVMLYVFNFYSITYKTALFWGTMITILFLLRYEKTKKTGYLILSALALSADVLGYPPVPVLLLVPVTRLLLKDRASARRSIALFWGTCALCALTFLLSIFLRYSLSDVMEMYVGGDIYKTTFFGPAAKKMGEILLVFLAAEAAFRIAKRSGLLASRGERLWEALSVLFWCALIASVALKAWSAQVSRFWYVFLGFFLCVLVLRIHGLLVVRHAQLVDSLFYEVSAWTILGIALMSDQGIAIIAYGAIFGLIGACMALLEEDNRRFGRAQLLAGSLLLAMLLSAAIFVSDEISNISSSNVIGPWETVEEGPGKGLRVKHYTMQRYDSVLQAARGCTDSDDRLFVISDYYRPLGPMGANVVEAIPCGYQLTSYTRTTKGIEYCARFPELSPTVVLVDTEEIGDYEIWWENTVFARYLEEHFEQESQSEDGRWIVLRRSAED